LASRSQVGSERTGFALWLKLCLRLTMRLLTLLKDAQALPCGSSYAPDANAIILKN